MLAFVGRLEADARTDQPARPAPAVEPVQSTRADSKAAYDSAERRERFAHSLAAAGVEPEVINGLLIADLSQGAAATQATADVARKHPRARKAAVGTGAAVGKQHGDRGR